MKPRINIITLGVTDLAKSEEFYNGLGWKKSSASQGDIIFYQLGGIALALYPREALKEDARTTFAPNKGCPPISLGYCTQSEEEVDSLLQKAVKYGAKLIKPAEKAFWGGYSGYFADPSGFLWEVAHNPFIGFDEQENILLP